MKKSPKSADKPLKSLIEASGYTQKQLAEEIGVAYSLIRFYVAGQSTPGFDKACAMSKVLNCSLKTLAKAMGYDVSKILDDTPK